MIQGHEHPWEQTVKENNLYLLERLSRAGEALLGGKGHFGKTFGVDSEAQS